MTTWAQIAAWTKEDVERVAEAIGMPARRIEKGDWVQKAKDLLADPPG